MRIRLLGDLEATGADGNPLQFATRKAALLFAALVLAERKGLRRDKIAAILWADRAEAQARNSLRQALVEVRRTLSTLDGSILVEGDADAVRLIAQPSEADVWEFKARCDAGDPGSLAVCADLFQGDLLETIVMPSEFEEWIALDRAAYRRRAEQTAERLSLAKPLGEQAEMACERLAQRLVALDPATEQAHRALIRIYLNRGNSNEAFRQFRHCRAALKRELGVEPEQSTKALIEPLDIPRDQRWTVLSSDDFDEPAQYVENLASPPSVTRLSAREKPSIAVLPFQNMSDDPEQEYFTDGVVEEITTALSRVNWLFVIARNSAFAYKGRMVDIKLVARELGVRYLVEGSVRKAGTRLRVAGQLIDASTGLALWADRFDGDVSEVFELQDLIASAVIGAISPRLERAEIERAKRKPTESLDAYDCQMRGMASLYRWTRDGMEEALPYFYKAIDRDPDYAAAYGAAAWCYFWRMANGWMADRDRESKEVARLVDVVCIAGKDDAVALAFGGLALGYVLGDHEQGAALTGRALLLNPNCAAAWSASGCLKACHGDPDTAIEHMARAQSLSPLDPLMFFMKSFTAFAHFVACRYELAWPLADAASRTQPYYVTGLRIAAASNAFAGRLEAARKHMDAALKLDPALNLANLHVRVGRIRPDYFARYTEALRLAGLPD